MPGTNAAVPAPPPRPRILLIRRDNIGDLALTTPLLAALRATHPQAWLGVLANSYNAPVLDGHPHLDALFTYDKAKHRPQANRFGIYLATARTLLALRRLHIDWLILAGPAPQRQAHALARWIAPQRMSGFVTAEFAPASITHPVPYGDGASLHETADIFRLLAPLGVGGEIPACRVAADAGRAAMLRQRVEAQTGRAGPLIGVQISARRLRQRWPLTRFAQLLQALHARGAAPSPPRFMLFWAPGAADDAHHPGDDAEARQLLALLPPGFPVFAAATASVQALIAGLSLCDLVITPDGGAMHLAAGLGKPVIALFGDSPAVRWHPWRVPHVIVQGAQADVAAISVAEMLSAWEQLAPMVLSLQQTP